jgi:glutamyl-tRNA synthetase
VGRASAIFDEQKLRWMNGRFMRSMDPEEYERRLAEHLARSAPSAGEAFAAAPLERRRTACEIVAEKAQTLNEVWPLIGFLFEPPADDEKAWRKVMRDGAGPLLASARQALARMDSFEPDAIESALAPVLSDAGVKPGRLYQPIRVAITGTTVSPGIFESLSALGREASLERIDAALARLDAAQH